MGLGDRSRAVRKAYGCTQQVFADRLGLKQNTIATYEIEKTTPSDRTLTDICRVFHVHEAWLRTGEGEMLQSPTPQDQGEDLAAFLGQVAGENSFRSRLISALSRLSQEDWAVLERLAAALTTPEE